MRRGVLSADCILGHQKAGLSDLARDIASGAGCCCSSRKCVLLSSRKTCESVFSGFPGGSGGRGVPAGGTSPASATTRAQCFGSRDSTRISGIWRIVMSMFAASLFTCPCGKFFRARRGSFENPKASCIIYTDANCRAFHVSSPRQAGSFT